MAALLRRFVRVTVVGVIVIFLLYVATRGSPSIRVISYKDTKPGPAPDVSVPTCTEVHHFAFIKVHKCGSTIIASMNFRFGLSRNLTFVLPTDRFMIASRLYEPWEDYLPPPKDREFDILTDHAVYNKLELSRLLRDDTQYTAILRHPYSQMRSALYFFDIIKKVPDKNISLYLDDPWKYSRNTYPINAMSRELGMDPKLYTTEKSIAKYIRSIKDDFRIVMILERLDESLVLLKRYFCWTMSDIIVSKNANPRTPRDSPPEAELIKHKKVALADYMLYEHYYNRLDAQILAEGNDFQGEMAWYRVVKKLTLDYCATKETSRPAQLRIKASAWNSPITITSLDCQGITSWGFAQTDRAKAAQYGKWNITKYEVLASYNL